MEQRFKLARKRPWLLLTDAVGALKEALTEIRVNSFILISLVGKIVWLLPLLVSPDLFATNPTFYRAFEQQWPQWAWASIIGSFAVFDVVALTLRRFPLDLAALGVGVFLCAFLASLASMGAPHGRLGLPAAPFVYIYLFGAGGCLVGMLRRVSEWGPQQDAANLIRFRTFMEREIGADRL